MKVRATKKGYHGRWRDVDDEFDIPDGEKLGTWMEEVKAPVSASPLDHDGDGKAGGSTAPAPSEELTGLRATYKSLAKKNYFAGWNIATLKAKIAALGETT